MARRPTIGRLDQRVVFQQETLVDDGQGANTSSGWSNIADTPKMWAQVQTRPGNESDGGEGRVANEYQINVIVRSRNDIDERHALLWRGRLYNIQSVGPYDGRREYMEIVAYGGVPL